MIAAVTAQNNSVISDPDSPELRKFARPAEIDESEYGSGPLLHPGTTYYVSLQGSDEADGLSWDNSWKTVRHSISQLEPGDTLLIHEGNYNEPDLLIDCTGDPGKPITITAAPGHRVLLTGAVYPELLRKTPDTLYTYEFAYKPLPRYAELWPENAGIWEEPAFIKLENGGTITRVDELPGTFHYNSAENKLYVHFSDSRGPEANRLAVTEKSYRGGGFRFPYGGVESFGLTGSYVHLRGIHFRYGFAALALYDAYNTTVENCSFFATDYAGLVLFKKARRNLIKNNYGIRNGRRGGIIFSIQKPYFQRGDAASDNLIIGNHMDSSAPTMRTLGAPTFASIRSYGFPGPGNHVINNIMNEPGTTSFLYRATSIKCTIQGNVLTGNFQAHNWHGEFAEDGSERVVVRNNTILGSYHSPFFTSPSDEDESWMAKDIAYLNNLVLGRRGSDEEAQEKRIENARFADPAYLDYRLQADSPFIGAALGSGNKGAYYKQESSIYYVSPEGSDKNAGTSDKEPLKSLAAAAGKLKEGDTLYIGEGSYSETLSVSASGTPNKPILVRAHGKKQVVLGGAVLSGGFIELEGLTLSGARGDGLLVKEDNVSVKNCLMLDNTGAGIKAQGAKGLRVKNCTFAGSGTGIALQEGSTGAIVRDSLFAENTGKPVDISKDSQSGYLASHNAYSGEQGAVFAKGEWGSVYGEMRFVDAKNKDYRVYSDSPAAYTGIYAGASGAFEAVPRRPGIEGLKATNVRDKSAVVSWKTPVDDTTGKAYYRLKGQEDWSEVETPGQGTIHIAGLTGLVQGKEYEFQAEASGRRGGVLKSAVLSFKTADKPLAPRTLYISPDGNDNADGLSPKTAWRTMRKANTDVGPGDTVLAAPGEYLHPIAPLVGGSPDMRITYKKNGSGEVVLNGYDSVAPPIISLKSTSYVTVDGFKSINTADAIGSEIEIRHSHGVKILNCRIEAFGGMTRGVGIINSHDMLFEGNIIWGTRYDITPGGSPGLVIKNNTFAGGGIYSLLNEGNKNTKIFNNIFYHNIRSTGNPILMLRNINPSDIESDYNLFCLRQRNGTDLGRVGDIAVYNEAKSRWEITIPGANLKEWQKNSGLDKHSLQTDPLFADPENGDFRLKPGSPAIGNGLGGENIGALGIE